MTATSSPSGRGLMNTDLTGQLIADERYEVRRRLGTGSMGHVFHAWDNRLETDVVLKVPTLARLQDAEFRTRFLRESRFLVKLTHPRIVTILDVGEHEGVPYFVMQYVGGGSLESRIATAKKQKKFVALADLKSWLPGTAEALDFMHGKGFVHRDVKPANILYDVHGIAYLSDFGLSKRLTGNDRDLDGSSGMTAAGSVVGTPNYVAPEVVLGEPYDGRADQYSLAMTLYEALTGTCPLEGPTASATMVNQTAKLPPPPHTINQHLSQRLSAVVMRALSKTPAERFASCSEFAGAVLQQAGLSSPDLPAGRPSEASRSSARHNGITDVQRQPSYSIVNRSRVKKGKAPCPKCEVPLIVKDDYAGRKGYCKKCRATLIVSRDMKEVRQVKLISQQARDEFNLEIGTEVFGWRLNRRQAQVLIGILLFVVIGSSVAIGIVAATQKDEKDAAPVMKLNEQAGVRTDG